jgi:hypothetical protein
MRRLLLLAGLICILAGGLAAYGRRAVVDQRGFTQRAVGTLRQDEVDDEIADRVSRRLVDRDPRLARIRPVLDAGAADLVADPLFARVFAAAVARMHGELFAGDAGVELTLSGAARRCAPPRRATRPRWRAWCPPTTRR